MIAALWLLAACAGNDREETGTKPDPTCDCPTTTPDTTPSVTDTAVVWPPPTVDILVPGSIAVGPSMIVDLRVTDFLFVGPPIGDQTGGGTGGTGAAPHAHPPTARPSGYVRVTLDGAVVAEEPATRFYLDGVGPGDHYVQAELVYPDGEQFFPPVLEIQQFTIE